MPLDPFLIQSLKDRIKQASFFIGLWVLFVGVVVLIAAQYIQDFITLETIAIGAGAALLLWWLLVSWRQKVHLLLELQETLTRNHILPSQFPRFKNSAPWNVGEKRRKMLAAAANEYRALMDKTHESNQTLEKYVGSTVTDQAAKKALRSELGGEERRVYVLFSDVRGFTHMTELLKPEETLEILNTMFTAMEEVITQSGGDINKYIGDAIFAYFRRPYGGEGEASKMVLRAALRMQDRFEALNKSFKVAYSKPVDIGLGIGITAGSAIVGNLGSTNRMEFTLIGDTVNLA